MSLPVRQTRLLLLLRWCLVLPLPRLPPLKVSPGPKVAGCEVVGGDPPQTDLHAQLASFAFCSALLCSSPAQELHDQSVQPVAGPVQGASEALVARCVEERGGEGRVQRSAVRRLRPCAYAGGREGRTSTVAGGSTSNPGRVGGSELRRAASPAGSPDCDVLMQRYGAPLAAAGGYSSSSGGNAALGSGTGGGSCSGTAEGAGKRVASGVETGAGSGGGNSVSRVVQLLPVVLGKGTFGRVVDGTYLGQRVPVMLLASDGP
jgi:hypothetical protein